jgi:hypothetical protein
MAATLDGRIQGRDGVFEAKFMLPWSFSEEAAAEKYMPQLQHNMRVAQLFGVTAVFWPTPSGSQPLHIIYGYMDIWVSSAAGVCACPGRRPTPLGRSSMFRRGKSNPNSPDRVIVNKTNPSLLEG